jgi:hypothetical protein
MISANWFYRSGEEVIGPISEFQLGRRAYKEEIGPHTFVRRGEDGEWVAARTVEGLFANGSTTDAARAERSKSAQNWPQKRYTTTFLSVSACRARKRNERLALVFGGTVVIGLPLFVVLSLCYSILSGLLAPTPSGSSTFGGPSLYESSYEAKYRSSREAVLSARKQADYDFLRDNGGAPTESKAFVEGWYSSEPRP